MGAPMPLIEHVLPARLPVTAPPAGARSVPAAPRTAAEHERPDQGEDQEEEQQRAQETEETEAEAERMPSVVGHGARRHRGAGLGEALGKTCLVRADAQDQRA